MTTLEMFRLIARDNDSAPTSYLTELLQLLDAAAEREAKLRFNIDRLLIDCSEYDERMLDHAAFKSAATLKIEGLERENRTLRQAMVRLTNLSFPNGMRDRFKEAVNDIAAEALKNSEPTADAANNAVDSNDALHGPAANTYQTDGQ